MSQPSHYQQVIQRVIERNAERGLNPSELADAIVEGLDLAEAILGDGRSTLGDGRSTHQAAKRGVLVQTSPANHYRPVDLDKGLLIGQPSSNGARIVEEAPPTAMVRNPDSAVIQDSYEEVEKKKALLQNAALNTLPMSIRVELPDVGTVTLARHVRPSPQGTDFVRVLYAQDASEEDGPQVNLFTADMKCDPTEIKAEILRQAAMRYRKTRPTITPRMAPSTGFPDTDEMTRQALTAGNSPYRTDETTSRQEIDDWNRLTKSNI